VKKINNNIFNKDFCEKNVNNLPDFEQRTISIARTLQQVSAGSQNIKGILKIFYFHIWSIAKNWQNILIGDCQFGYIKNLRKNQNKTLINTHSLLFCVVLDCKMAFS
jgi:hypothetical protein